MLAQHHMAGGSAVRVTNIYVQIAVKQVTLAQSVGLVLPVEAPTRKVRLVRKKEFIHRWPVGHQLQHQLLPPPGFPAYWSALILDDQPHKH